jgi:hypothetical protein
MKRTMLAAVCLLLAAPCVAESIRIDAAPEHITNTIRPTEALGAGVDRLPYGAADKLLKEETIRRVLAAGPMVRPVRRLFRRAPIPSSHCRKHPSRSFAAR